MDDLQFNASLDALLGNETLDTGQTTGSNNASMVSSLSFTSPQQQQQQQYSMNGITQYHSAVGNTLPRLQDLLNSNPGPSTSSSIAPYLHGYGQLDNRQAATIAAGKNIVPNHNMLPLSLSQDTFLTQGSQHRGSIASSVSEGKQYSGNKRTREGGGGGESISKNGTMVEVSEDEDDRAKRRQDRNLREQQRSQRITQQIDHLRSVLAEAKIRHKPDKFSTLITVGEYIKQLQERSAMLDAEHKKLIDTITRTNELANQPQLPVPSNPSCNGPEESISSSSGLIPGTTNTIYNDDELVFVRNVDYKCIFIRCGVPLAVASIDGRILDCNHAFEEMTGYKRQEVLPTEHVNDDSVTTDVDGISSSMSSSEELTNLSGGAEGTLATPKGESGEQIEKSNNHNASLLPSSRNLSLFNLLSRDCMELVFLALSRILKHPTLHSNDDNGNTTARDFWSGSVRLNRKKEVEMRLNIVLVRNTDGKAKFFNCFFAPVSQSYR